MKNLLGLLLLIIQPLYALELYGEMTQGAMLRGRVTPGASIELNGEAIHVSPKGEFVFGFGRDAELEHQLSVKKPNGSTEVEKIILTPREYKIQRINGIAQSIMQPSEDDIARAIKDTAMTKEARNKSSERTDFFNQFIWPLEGRITGVYGSQRFYNGEPRRPHFGIDIAAPQGTEVVAPADGQVTLWVPDMFFSGGTLIIDHGHGISSSFIHLSGSIVAVGDEVKRGQAIALVGSTGRSTGPHLDWRINWFDVRLDPSTVVPDMP